MISELKLQNDMNSVDKILNKNENILKHRYLYRFVESLFIEIAQLFISFKTLLVFDTSLFLMSLKLLYLVEYFNLHISSDRVSIPSSI